MKDPNGRKEVNGKKAKKKKRKDSLCVLLALEE